MTNRTELLICCAIGVLVIVGCFACSLAGAL